MMKAYRVLIQFTFFPAPNAWGVGEIVAINSNDIGNLVSLGYLEEVV